MPRPPLTVLILLLAAPALTHADADSEREALARIAQEVDHLKLLVADAGRAPGASARVKFRYDWLEKDLELIHQGIADHLDAPRQPRPVAPLRGDYRR